MEEGEREDAEVLARVEEAAAWERHGLGRSARGRDKGRDNCDGGVVGWVARCC